MDFATLALACIIHITAGGEMEPVCDNEFIKEVAAAVDESSNEFGVPPAIIAAVIYHESHFDQNACSSKKAMGLMQVLRHGAVQGKDLKLKPKQLCDIKTNIRIGTAYLARVLMKCKTFTAGLTGYNGGGCVSSNYSQGVLADLKMGRKAIRDL